MVSSERIMFCMAATPFKDDTSLDEEALRIHLRRLIAAGNGVYLGSGGAGEGHVLTVPELRRIYDVGVDECKGKIPVYCNPPEARTAKEMLAKLQEIANPLPAQYLLSFVRGNIYIPEPILVGLAALEEYEPAWVREEKLFSQLVLCAKAKLENPQAGEHDERYEVLLEVVSEHLKVWDNWSNMEHYRRAYLQLGSEAGQPPEGPRAQRAAGAGAGQSL